jgi:flavin-dependent dehydrogenase
MRRAYSGHACLLAGDAATLADPLMGNGIDKAVISGLLAAKQAAASFHSGDLGQKAMSNYDRSIRLALGKEIMRNRRQRILLSRFPALLGLYARFRK